MSSRGKTSVPFERGLHSVGREVWAWLQPPGGLGWSNAGLVAADGESLLVDTLFDLRLTAEMLDGMGAITVQHPLRWAVNTHDNGDHTFGNELLGDEVRILAAKATAEAMVTGTGPAEARAMLAADLGPVLTPYLRDHFESFSFDDLTLRMPDETYGDERTIELGGRTVRVINLGPAHTEADSVVFVPDAGVVFAGDLLFIGSTPIVWFGPLELSIRACDALLALDAPTVVPGHGPVTDPDGILQVRGYFEYIDACGRDALARGVDLEAAAFAVDLGPYATLLDAEFAVVNLYQVYRELDPEQPELSQVELFTLMAKWHAAHTEA